MPRSDYNVNINLKTTDKTSPAVKKAGGALGMLGKAATIAGAAMVALKVATAAIKFAKFGAKVQRAADSLHFLARSAGQSSDAIVRHMQAASDGTIDRMTAMSVANKALLMGVAKTPEQFAKLSKNAIVLGRAMGMDAASAIDRFIVAAGRQSELIADDFGILMDATSASKKYAASIGKTTEQLTKSEKAQAFMNEMMRQAEEKTQILKGSTGGLATQNEQLKAQWLDVKANASQVWAKFVEGTGIVEALTNILWGLDNALGILFPKALGKTKKALEDTGKAAEDTGMIFTDILVPIKTAAKTQEDMWAKEAKGLSTAADIWEMHRIRIKDAVEQGAEDQLTAMEALMLLETRRADAEAGILDKRLENFQEFAKERLKSELRGKEFLTSREISAQVAVISKLGGTSKEVNEFLRFESARRNAAVKARLEAEERLKIEKVRLQVEADQARNRAEMARTRAGLQHGTRSALGGMTLVGEGGPEMVNMRPGARVFNNQQTTSIFNQTVNTQATQSNVMNDFALASALAG